MKHEEEEWTEVISSEMPWWNLKLKEVWRYRDLVKLFVWRDFIAAYKQTILGPVWLVLNPLISSVLYTIMFGIIANIDMEGVPALLFQLCSMTSWNFFLRNFSATQATFLGNAGIFSKVYFPRLTVPIASVISNMVQYAILMSIFLVAFAAYKYVLGTNVQMNPLGLVCLPLLLLLSSVLGVGLGAIVAAFTTKYRDFGIFIGYAIQVLMYGSAVVYPLSFVQTPYKEWIVYNPVVTLLEGFRYAFLNIGSLDFGNLLYVSIWAIVAFLIGIVLFNRTERDFIDTV
jgi:lipopolysaccharide transport system permease protein